MEKERKIEVSTHLQPTKDHCDSKERTKHYSGKSKLIPEDGAEIHSTKNIAEKP